MLPYIDLGFSQISSYGLCVLCGLIAFTVTVVFTLEKREGAEKKLTNRMLILSAFGFVVLVLSALIMNSVFHSIEKQAIRIGGITWLGGVIFAFPFMYWLIDKLLPQIKGEALEYFNLLIPGIVLGHGFGRVGCFLGGCCYGMQVDTFLSVSFPAGSPAALAHPDITGASLPVLPTQLFEAAFEFALFAVMFIGHKKLKKWNFEIYAFTDGIFRFALEFLRGDDRGATGLLFTPSQIMSVILILGGVMSVLYKKGLLFRKYRAKMQGYKAEREKYGFNFTGNITQILRELHALLQEQVITEEEYASVKEQLLQKLAERGDCIKR